VYVPSTYPVVAVVESVTVSACGTAAVDGTTESIPKPKAATATSAMRLKLVFVDICFLSLVEIENFSVSA
jgi:hypothetical protein